MTVELPGGSTVCLMDGFRRRTVKNIKMWTEMDGWTDGRKSVRRGLVQREKLLEILICINSKAPL